MKIDAIKLEFHELIDRIDNPDILTQFYNAITQSLKSEGSLWNSLTSEQQKLVLEAYEASEDESILISLDEIKAKFK